MSASPDSSLASGRPVSSPEGKIAGVGSSDADFDASTAGAGSSFEPRDSTIDHDDESLRMAYNFSLDVIDKQYRSYTWSDGKVQALVTIDAGLIAGVLLILQINVPASLYELIFLSVAFILFLASFLVCLVHAIPRMHSGVGNQENLRTIIGIANLDKEAYHNKIRKLTTSDMLRMNCWQIAGMAKNNSRSHKLIQIGVYLTFIGAIFFAITLSVSVLSNWAKHRETLSEQQADNFKIAPTSILTNPQDSKASDNKKVPSVDRSSESTPIIHNSEPQSSPKSDSTTIPNTVSGARAMMMDVQGQGVDGQSRSEPLSTPKIQVPDKDSKPISDKPLFDKQERSASGPQNPPADPH